MCQIITKSIFQLFAAFCDVTWTLLKWGACQLQVPLNYLRKVNHSSTDYSMWKLYVSCSSRTTDLRHVGG